MKNQLSINEIKLLQKLLDYSHIYEINIQFWPTQTTIYIAKDGVDLTDYGGDFEFAVTSCLNYLNRINQKTNE